MPKILMKLYFHIRKEHYRIACFYAKSFELHDESERLFVCPYQKMKRVILSERYLILVFPKMLASVPAKFASTERPVRMNGVGSSVEAV